MKKTTKIKTLLGCNKCKRYKIGIVNIGEGPWEYDSFDCDSIKCCGRNMFSVKMWVTTS